MAVQPFIYMEIECRVSYSYRALFNLLAFIALVFLATWLNDKRRARNNDRKTREAPMRINDKRLRCTVNVKVSAKKFHGELKKNNKAAPHSNFP